VALPLSLPVLWIDPQLLPTAVEWAWLLAVGCSPNWAKLALTRGLMALTGAARATAVSTCRCAGRACGGRASGSWGLVAPGP